MEILDHPSLGHERGRGLLKQINLNRFTKANGQQGQPPVFIKNLSNDVLKNGQAHDLLRYLTKNIRSNNFFMD